MDKISILTTVYNGEKHFNKAIPSILNQSFQNFEYIIINDGSTDNTSFMLEEIIRNDRRIKVYNVDRIGRANALNYGIQKASNELIAIQDFDDESFPNRIHEQVLFFEKNPKIVWAGCNYILDNLIRKESYEVKVPFEHNQIINHMSHSIPWAHTFVMFRKKEILSVGGYPNFDGILDLRLPISLAEKGFLLGNIPLVLGRHYVYEESFWNSNFKYSSRMIKIAKVQIDAINKLELRKWRYIFPIGRVFYAFIPNWFKKFVRRNIVKVKEQDL